MMKSGLSALCRLHIGRSISHIKNGTTVVSPQRVCRLHVGRCLQVIDRDLPGKASADRLRNKEEAALKAEDTLNLTLQDLKVDSIFPTLETHSMLINGTRYDELPIIHVKASHNNTIITAVDHKGKVLCGESGGTVGFRNARKGTNIAAQAAAIALAEKVVKKGVNLARICVNGIGPGRLPAIKGLQMSGITVVSITDSTKLPYNGHRPKKQRRL